MVRLRLRTRAAETPAPRGRAGVASRNPRARVRAAARRRAESRRSPLPPADHNLVIDFRERFLRPRGPLDRAHLKSSALEVVLVYRQFVERLLNPAPPKLQNTDGDPLEPTTLEFELRCGVREALDRPKGPSRMTSDEGLLDDAEWADDGELTKAVIVWGKKGNKLHQGGRRLDSTTAGPAAALNHAGRGVGRATQGLRGGVSGQAARRCCRESG